MCSAMQADTLKRDTGKLRECRASEESIESISASQRTTSEVGGSCPASIAIVNEVPHHVE
jgi:hypothetical protein